MQRLLLAIIVLYGSVGVELQAAIIFNNGMTPANVVNAGFSDFAPPNPPNTFIFEHADDFTLIAGANTVTKVRWLGLYSDFGTDAGVPSSDDFTLRVFAANGPNSSAQFGDGLPLPGDLVTSFAPGNAVNRQATASILPTLNVRVYSYEADIGSLTLNPGRYWLSIINNTVADTNDTWYWGSLGTSGNGTSRFTDPANPPITEWSIFGDKQLAFQLVDDAAAVPVPAAVPLFISGLAALSLIGKRRRLGK